jgi:1-aminocyclopropane-1-carboxylate deaminase/D-cysteine desulfhydrase-like pyridoxal-dependent ACC family enzyme
MRKACGQPSIYSHDPNIAAVIDGGLFGFFHGRNGPRLVFGQVKLALIGGGQCLFVFVFHKTGEFVHSINYVRCSFFVQMEILPEFFQQQPSPLQALPETHGIRLLVKRDDLLHPHISGNKWRKLKYNLLEAKRLGRKKLLTFGGAYSNHLAAVAAAGQEFGFSTLGIVRGERALPLNPTLSFVEKCGMELVYMSRANFSNKSHISFLEHLKIKAEDYYILPEGGSNCLALQGAAELVGEIENQLSFVPNYICTACGTGATLAGIVSGLRGRGAALGISVLKGDFLKNEVSNFLQSCGETPCGNWQISTDYHFGGYAKFTPELVGFINDFKQETGIPLDPIYTGKLFYAVFDLMKKGFFEKGATVVLVHTGGLQGVAGFNERFGNLIT